MLDDEFFDPDFRQELGQCREHQAAQMLTQAPSIFSDLIQKLETSSIQNTQSINVSEFWSESSKLVADQLYQHSGASDLSSKFLV